MNSKSPRTTIKRSTTNEAAQNQVESNGGGKLSTPTTVSKKKSMLITGAIKFAVHLKNFKVVGLKKDLVTKPDSYLEINFGNYPPFLTSVFKNDENPHWDHTFQFEYSSINLKNEKFTVKVWDVHRFGGESILGSIELDLFSIVTGPQDFDLSLKKKNKKKGTEETAKGRIQFTIEALHKPEVSIYLSNVKCKRIRPASSPKLFSNWSNDSYLTYYLESNPSVQKQTDVCYNTLFPSWMECDPLSFCGTLKELLSQTLVIVLHHSHVTPELLGECKVPISHYASLKTSHLKVPFNEPLTYLQATFGEIKARLGLKGIPAYSQLEGGRYTDTGITGNARPILSDCPIPKETQDFKVQLDQPLFAPSTKTKRSTGSKVVEDSSEIQKAIKDTLKKLRSSYSSIQIEAQSRSPTQDSLKVPKEHIDLRSPKHQKALTARSMSQADPLEKKAKPQLDDKYADIISEFVKLLQKNKDDDNVPHLFRKEGVIVTLLKKLKVSSPTVQRIICQVLMMVIHNNEKNLSTIRFNESLPVLCKMLQTEDLELFGNLAAILIPLSIRDSGAQEIFQKKETIRFLVETLGSSKNEVVTKSVVKLLSNLSYGKAGGNPNNRDVIRLCGGIKQLIQKMEIEEKDLRIQIVGCLEVLIHTNNQNRKEVISLLVPKIDSKDSNNVIYFLGIIETLLSDKINNIPTAEDIEVRKFFLDNAAVMLMKLQATSDDKRVADLAQNLLKKYSYSGSEEHLIGSLVKELWSPTTSSMAINSITNFISKNPNASKPLDEAISNGGALVPLFDTIRNPINEEALRAALKLVKKVTVNIEIAKIAIDQGGNETCNLLTKLLDHQNTDIQNYVVDTLFNLVKVEKKDVVFDIEMVLKISLERVSHSPSLKLKLKFLKLLYEILKNADISFKVKFKELNGIQSMNRFITQGPNYAEFAVKIIHAICFPLVDELLQVVECVAKEGIFETFCTQLANPHLLSPDVHPIIPAILSTIKDLFEDKTLRSSLEDQVVTTLGHLTSNFTTGIGQEARNCLKSWDYGSVCSYVSHGLSPFQQSAAECVDCGLTDEDCVCMSCIETCHRGHQIRMAGSKVFYCKCGSTPKYCCAQKVTKAAKPLTVCTFSFNRRKLKNQEAYSCKTCFTAPDKYVCSPCSKSNCHKGHMLIYSGILPFACTCGDRFVGCTLQVVEAEDKPKESKPEELAKQQKEDDEESICIVCYSSKKDTIFYKCGHLACCFNCASMTKNKNHPCPICRSAILDVIKVFQV